MSRYNSYGSWLRKKFGSRVQKVTVDGGFTCPNRDGTVGRGGCTYCNNNSFRGWGTSPQKTVEEQIQEGMAYLKRRFKAERFIIYWQNFSNTYASVERLEELYSRSLKAAPGIVGMSIGTRSDCVPPEVLEMISRFRRNYYICMEYGLESIFDDSLKKVNRGHDFQNYSDAVTRTKAQNLDVCAHIILGFPWESRGQFLEYPEVLNRLKVDFLKIHHLHIVKGTRLAQDYLKDPFRVFTCEEWIDLVCDVLERIDPEIVLQRLFGWTPESAVLAPVWNRSRAEILLAIEGELEKRDSWQGKRFQSPVQV